MKDRTYLVNFISMNICWCFALFGYYMLGFYVKYIPGDIFTNIIISSVAEGSACVVQGIFSTIYGTKHTFIVSIFLGGTFAGLLSWVNEE